VRILIAEDDLTSHRVLKAVLEKWKYEVVSTYNGAEAWQAIQLQDAPHFAILDWMMPELDGLELIRRIRGREQLRGAYLILLTAKGQKEDIVAGLEAGANDYLTKPFDHQELQARVRVGQRVTELQEQLAARIRELETALAEIRTLTGLIPMCAGCKRIRDDKGYWQKVERYIMEHSEAAFSHGLCPECMHKHYPEYFQIKARKEREKEKKDSSE
jgi:sigma-B regulation protein RsbU (phosphoserine phosphatase)